MMEDYLVRAMAAGGELRCCAITSGHLVEEAHRAHGTTPVISAALGRTLTGALMMSDLLKGEEDLMTVRFDGDGPAGSIIVTADRRGNAKGYVQNSQIWLPLKPDGHLDVGRAVGEGTLTVIRDLDGENSYTGQTKIRTGEIAEDLTSYYAESEQVPSSIGLGVLVDTDQSIRQAGGFLIQLMPSASEETIDRLENNLHAVHSVTDMLEAGLTPEQMLETVLAGFDAPLIVEKMQVRFHCNCSRDRVERALSLIGKEELSSIIREGNGTELTCQFCGRKYFFTTQELRKIQVRSYSGL